MHGVSIDLSKATNLRGVVIRLRNPDGTWAGLMFKTLTSEHKDLRWISIYMGFRGQVDIHQLQQRDQAEISRRWRDLDHTLVQLWESNKTATRIIYITAGDGKTRAREYAEQLLPEITRRGIVELVAYSDSC